MASLNWSYAYCKYLSFIIKYYFCKYTNGLNQCCKQHWLKKKKEREYSPSFRVNNTRFQSIWMLLSLPKYYHIHSVTRQLKSLFQSIVSLWHSFMSFLSAMELANLIFYIYMCVWHLALAIWLKSPSTFNLFSCYGSMKIDFPFWLSTKYFFFFTTSWLKEGFILIITFQCILFLLKNQDTGGNSN